jgi:hypothetical protein
MFRFNIYSLGKDGKPDTNLLNQSIYFTAIKQHGWQKVDLKPYHIVVDRDVFISAQYIQGYPVYKYFSGVTVGTKAWIKDASDSYWEETPLGAAMYLVVKY